MSAFIYDKERGLVIPDTSQIRLDTIAWWQNITGNPDVPDPSSLEGRIVDAEVLARNETASEVAFISNQFNPEYAQGEFLDALCALNGIKRRGAERSTVECQITGNIGTIIPQFSEAKDENGQIWITTETILMKEQVMVVTFVSKEYGSIYVANGKLSKINTPVLGWLSIVNTAPSTYGRLAQTDASLRQQRRQEIALNSRTNAQSIMSEISSLDGVRKVTFFENYTNETINTFGVDILPHSTYVCVDGGVDSDIASAYQIKSAGCGYSASKKDDNDHGIRTEVDWVDPYSKQKITVAFDRPRLKKVWVRVTIEQSVVDSVVDTIKKLVYNYSLQDDLPSSVFSMGVTTTPFEICSYLNSVLLQLFVYTVEVSTDGVTYSTLPIKNKLFEKAYIQSEGDISVTVI